MISDGMIPIIMSLAEVETAVLFSIAEDAASVTAPASAGSPILKIP